MALSAEQRKRLYGLLGELDAKQRESALASESSFSSWLQRTARWLYDLVSPVVNVVYRLVRWFAA